MAMNSHKQTKLSDHIVKSIVQPISEARSFTTEPKGGKRKLKGMRVSLDRAKIFMEHLWSKGLKECSYETLEYEFIQCFGTNESRTLIKYIGRPERIIHYGGSAVVRVNKVNGKVAHFQYQNLRKVSAKKGLLEVLGFVSKKGNRYVLHHEVFPYSQKQVSILNLCVSPIGDDGREVSREVEVEKKKKKL